LAGTSDADCGSGGAVCSDCQAAAQTCRSQACCQPSCSGKACGADDGCGGTCQTGRCQSGQVCTAGKCKCDPACTGCCYGGDDGFCTSGTSSSACGKNGADCLTCSIYGTAYTCFEQGCRKCLIWRKSFPNTTLEDAVVDSDGTIYAAGTYNDAQFHLIKYDHCGNRKTYKHFGHSNWTKMWGNAIALEKEPGASGTATRVSLFGSAEIASGNSDGVWSHHNASDLAKINAMALTGGYPLDQVRSAVYSGGHYFMSGTADQTGSQQRFWLIKGKSNPYQACGYAALTALPNNGLPAHGRRVRAFGSNLYFSGNYTEAGKSYGIVWRMPNTGCRPSGCASDTTCRPVWHKQFRIGDGYAEFRDVYKSGSYLYAVGFYFLAGSNTDSAALIVRINESTGAATYKDWNPTAGIDGFHAITQYGSTFYLAGVEDWGATTTNGTRGMIAAYDSSLNQRWTRFPGDRSYRDIDIIRVPKAGLILTGENSNYGVVRRCDLDGNC
jgi:hypothetical protein